MLFHRDALARDGRFVDRGTALDQLAVDRDALAGTHNDQITDSDLLDRHLCFHAVAFDNGCLWRQVHQLCDRLGGLALGARLQKLAECDQRQDHAGGFKVEVHRIPGNDIRIAVSQAPSDHIDRHNAIDERGRRADRDQRIHIWRAAQQRLVTDLIVFAVDIDDRQRQQKLCKRKRKRVCIAMKNMRQRQPHHVPHGNVKQWYQKYKRYN